MNSVRAESMGTYREEIYTPYGPVEAAKRISDWLRRDGHSYKVLEQGPDRFRLRRTVPVNPSIVFQLRLTDDSVRAECWVQGMTQDPISPKAVWGAISRRTGWKDFLSLKELLNYGVDQGAL